MKTLYPIILSFGLLIPFSPVGEYLWHHSQDVATHLTAQTQSDSQSWWQSALSAQEELSDWFQQSKSWSWQQIDTQTLAFQQGLEQQEISLQQSLRSGQIFLYSQWQHSQQGLHQLGHHFWHETTQLIQGVETAIETLPRAYWSSHNTINATIDVDDDTTALNTISRVLHHPAPSADQALDDSP